jgi:5-enolpyruvylshikimate-3-phosphate synthase
MVAMCFAEGTSVISGAEELRHKETDRLSAMAEILALSGASTELKKDGIIIHGRPRFHTKTINLPVLSRPPYGHGCGSSGNTIRRI